MKAQIQSPVKVMHKLNIWYMVLYCR